MNAHSGGKEFTTPSVNLKRAAISAGAAFVFAFLIFMIAALLVLVRIIPEGAVSAIVIITTIASSFIAGFLTSKNVPMHGLVNGLFSGALYFVLLYILRMLTQGSFAVSVQLLLILTLILIGSAIGGITGINVRANRRSKRR